MDSPLLRLLANPWVLAAVWILGPAILIAIRRRNKRREEQAKKASSPAAPPPPQKERQTAVTQVPLVPMEVTPGFRDMKWGDEPNEHLDRVSENGSETIYTRKEELLRVEDVPVEAIHYIFSEGKFAAVRIDAPLHAAEPLHRALTQRWGNPDTQDPRAPKQQWGRLVSGPMPTAAVLERSSVSRRTTLFIFRRAQTGAAK